MPLAERCALQHDGVGGVRRQGGARRRRLGLRGGLVVAARAGPQRRSSSAGAPRRARAARRRTAWRSRYGVAGGRPPGRMRLNATDGHPRRRAGGRGRGDCAGLGEARREAFALRLDRWWGDLLDGLAVVYADPGAVARRLVDLAARAYAARPDDLHRLDQRRLLRARTGCSSPRMFGYACYTERFAGDLRRAGHAARPPRGARRHLPPPDAAAAAPRGRQRRRLRRPGLPRGPRRPRHGRRPARPRHHPARARDQPGARPGPQPRRPRARVGRSGPAPGTRRTATTSTSTPTAASRTRSRRRCRRSSPTSRPATSPGTTTSQAWVWTTFNEWQWDLNWANPDVLVEFADIVCSLANLGVEVLRLDAIAFLWKRLGHDLPEPARGARDHPGAAHGRPDRRAGAGVQGRGDRRAARPGAVPRPGPARRPGQRPRLPQQPDGAGLVDARHRRHRARPARARVAPAAPVTGTWITYVRCHDDIGWAIDDRDAAAVGLNGHDHRRFLADWYAGELPGTLGATAWCSSTTPPPATSGSAARAASLVGLRATDDRTPAWPGCSWRTRSSPAGAGCPVIWSGDELGQPNDPDWAGRARARGRQPVGAPAPARLGPRRAARRPAHRARQGVRRARPPGPGPRRAAAAARVRPEPGAPRHRPGRPGHRPPAPERPDGGPLQRDRARPRPFPIDRLRAAGLAAPYDALGGYAVTAGADGLVWLPAYAAWWVVDGPTDRTG